MKIDFKKPSKEIKFVTPNSNEINAIYKDAKTRYNTFFEQKNNKTMSKFVFENLYEALRELSEGIALSDGLKIYSHDYTLQYLIYKKYITDAEFSIFDDFRVLRNKSKYYGKDISFEKLKESIDDFNKLNKKLKSILKDKSS